MLTKMLTAIVLLYVLLLWQQYRMWGPWRQYWIVPVLKTQMLYNQIYQYFTENMIHYMVIPRRLLEGEDEVR